ncbi:MAG: hypothetical protein EP300_05040, partial [Gammaproteobacteria bacterium]
MSFIPSKKTGTLTLLGLLVGIMAYKFIGPAGATNGFDLSNSILPQDQILQGGPPRDGIPAL